MSLSIEPMHVAPTVVPTTTASRADGVRTPLLVSPPVPHSGAVERSLIGYEAGPVRDEEVAHNQLGVINGCYVPCLLNIMGIVLFERLAWGIGQQGVGGVLLIFGIAEMQAILTVLSLSAMVSNGNMRGGGSYFMISRTLGPEFGGSIGILFYAAYCVSVAFYCTGFAEEIVGTWWDSAENHPWMVVGFATVVLTFSLIVALLGARWFTKINVPLFCVQALAIFITMVAAFQRGNFKLPRDDYHHHEWRWSRFKKNWRTKCHDGWGGCFNFQRTFGVLFPAATGIMEGANLSGDQKNPSFAIPYGTLAAVATSIVTYALLILAFAGSYSEEPMIRRLTIFQETAYGVWGKYIVIMGVLISATSSSLGALFGGSRVLQAIARDKLFPGVSWLGYGSRDGDEPRIAVMFTWVIAQLLCLIGSVNLIAPIATAIFCMSYATVNISCFLLQVSGTPNWRPEFSYFTWHTCLAGFLLNLAVMFYTDYRFGSVALVCEVLVFAYLAYRAPQNVWGDVTQSVIFHQVRKYLLKLDESKYHAKLWRPSLLLLVDNSNLALIDFCNNLKKGGLYVVGTVIEGDYEQFSGVEVDIRRGWRQFLAANKIKAFPQIAVTPTARSGYENLLLLGGLGAMQPNTVVLPLLTVDTPHSQATAAAADGDEEEEEEDGGDGGDEYYRRDDEDYGDYESKEPPRRKSRRMSVLSNVLSAELRGLVMESPASMPADEYMRLVRHILDAERNVVLAANFDKLDSDLVVSSTLQSRVEEAARAEELERAEHKQQQADARRVAEESVFVSSSAIESTARSEHWVDVWIFAEEYTYDIDSAALTDSRDTVFPMLLMQLAHIMLLNRVWIKKASLRVFLIVNEDWDEDRQEQFDNAIKNLRLKIARLVPLRAASYNRRPEWPSLGTATEQKARLREYFDQLNATIAGLSNDSYLTLIRMPKLPPAVEELAPKTDSGSRRTFAQMAEFYFECLSILTRNLPPTALVATGETLPVISIEV